ncbi:MAG: thymidine kinase [Clostridia bacterium]|nr:thymidine kinase [Clostridia bacterium]
MTKINVFTGPMFSGKTNLLLGAYERATIAHKKVLAFKPKLDNRFGDNVIKSRRFGEIEAICISCIEDLKNYDAEVYIIDEFQFLTGDIKVIVQMADEKDKVFFISGLDMTAEKKPFGHMPEILAVADHVEKCVAICNDCAEENAIYSYFLGKKDTDIVVGNNEYIPLCRKCYTKRMKKSAL